MNKLYLVMKLNPALNIVAVAGRQELKCQIIPALTMVAVVVL